VTSPARNASDGMGGDLSPALMKGGVLVFVALVLGTFLLWKGPDEAQTSASSPPATDVDGGADDGDGETDATEPAEGSDGTTVTSEATTTTEATEALPPEDVTVLVANASGIPGAASKVGETLAAEGYNIAEPDNAKEPSATTIVYYIADFEAEAQAVAEALGLDPDADGVVAEVPTPLPTQDENLGAAQVLVILGTDEAPTA
jgi:hypothetical protein